MSDAEGPSTPVVRNRVRRRRGGPGDAPAVADPKADEDQDGVSEGKDGRTSSSDAQVGAARRDDDKEDAPLLPSRDAKDENARPQVNDAQPDNAGGGGSSSSGGAGAGTGNRTSPKRPGAPDKPARPARGADASTSLAKRSQPDGGAGAVVTNVSEEAARAARLMGGPVNPTWFSFLRATMCCKMGYRMEPFYRHMAPGALYMGQLTGGCMLGVVIENVFAGAAFVTGLVRPKVRVHCVYVDSGFYVQGPGLPPASPCLTGACPLTQPSAMPYWRETLPITAPFVDSVSPNTLLLFELLDDRPSLKPNKVCQAMLILACR